MKAIEYIKDWLVTAAVLAYWALLTTAWLWLITSVVSAQVLLVASQPAPQLAPHDCPCQPECKCDPCVCKTQTKPVVSVKKVYSPQEASVTVQATKGKEAFRCSGTAIDTNLVLTCWHITRGSDWTYTINGKPATLLRSDSKSDVALFSTTETLKPVKVADEPLRAGEACVAFGHEWNRKGLWKFPANVVQVMRYRGFPNVSTRGRDPVQSGRSGGGLFNSRGELVGVCSARDGQDGLYCGLDAIKALIAPKAITPKQDTPEWIQDPACVTGQCPLIKKQALPRSLPTERVNPVGVSPGVSGLCPTGQCGPSNTPTRRWGRR